MPKIDHEKVNVAIAAELNRRFLEEVEIDSAGDEAEFVVSPEYWHIGTFPIENVRPELKIAEWRKRGINIGVELGVRLACAVLNAPFSDSTLAVDEALNDAREAIKEVDERNTSYYETVFTKDSYWTTEQFYLAQKKGQLPESIDKIWKSLEDQRISEKRTEAKSKQGKSKRVA